MDCLTDNKNKTFVYKIGLITRVSVHQVLFIDVLKEFGCRLDQQLFVDTVIGLL